MPYLDLENGDDNAMTRRLKNSANSEQAIKPDQMTSAVLQRKSQRYNIDPYGAYEEIRKNKNAYSD